MRSRPMLMTVAVIGVLAIVGVAVLSALALHEALNRPQQELDIKGEPAATVAPPDAVAQLEAEIPTEAVMVHLEALQRIAEENNGNRGTGEPGYEASVDYVVDVLEAAGYTPELHEVQVPLEVDRSTVEVHGTGGMTFDDGDGVAGAGFLGVRAASATGTLSAVDLPSGGGPGSSGCEAGDFAGLPSGAVALMQRGGCDFATKARNAQDAGAVAAVVIFTGDGSLVMRGDGAGLTIPVVSVTGEAARGLRAAHGTEVTVAADRSDDPLVVHSVTAQTPWGDPDAVIIAGGHLDSVTEGPGISDNGSGVAALLAVAEHMVDEDLPSAVRFAWWGAEEIGLYGSQAYVGDLSASERAAVAAYVNMDMVASPNHVFGIYDGDASLGSPVYGHLPPGSAIVEQAFATFFRDHGIPFEDTPLDGRSDYDAFITAGIASGGLFTGADEIKSSEQAERYGGVAGDYLDPCYHRPCDTLDNIDTYALTVSTNALASALRTLTGAMGSLQGPAQD